MYFSEKCVKIKYGEHERRGSPRRFLEEMREYGKDKIVRKDKSDAGNRRLRGGVSSLGFPRGECGYLRRDYTKKAQR